MECIINPVIDRVVGALLEPVKDHICFLISSKKNVDIMVKNLGTLNVEKRSIEDKLNDYKKNRYRTPEEVEKWLHQVVAINDAVGTVSSDVVSCFNLKKRHNLGKKAVKYITDIDNAIDQASKLMWTKDLIPPGKIIDPMDPPTFTSSSDYVSFPSREQTCAQVLKALKPDHKSRVIALWGVGGVGMTTMIDNLIKVVARDKTFNFIVYSEIGEKKDVKAIQNDVAHCLGIELKGGKLERVKSLGEEFVANSDGGKTKFLVILDDVWEKVLLKDIGLSCNNNVDFKVLLASRDRQVCTRMGAEMSDSIFEVKVLAEAEGHILFRRYAEISDDVDQNLRTIGECIVRRCWGLPAAIRKVAADLKGERDQGLWRDTLNRLEAHEIHRITPTRFETYYGNLENDEIKDIFLLCGLVQENLDIPTEELFRYAWGLKVFDNVTSIQAARDRLYTRIKELMHKNMLIGSDDVASVKMHDLVCDFVFYMFYKNKHASILNDIDSILRWSDNEMASICKWFSLTWNDHRHTSSSSDVGREFPEDVKFPNLKILKLVMNNNGDEFLGFRNTKFYREMKNLQVISFGHMKCPPLLPASLDPCYSKLRLLHLHECDFEFNCTSIGNLRTLEVLSFAKSSIDWLSSSIGKLNRLKLLDLTDCDAIRIDKDVLSKLYSLEELYTIAGGDKNGKSITFTDDNCSEIEERSAKYTALEFQFFQNNAQVNKMSFGKLERFKISVGRSLDRGFSKSRHSYENTLQLHINKVREVFESELNKLFEKTQVLCLTVGDMNRLEDFELDSTAPSGFSPFVHLRVLVFSKCANLTYLFTPYGVAKGLSKIEHLHIEACPNLEELIDTEGEGGGEGTITLFPNLKFLHLQRLPKFTSIYPSSDHNLATSSILKGKVQIPKLEKLHIKDMEALLEIWPREFSTTEEVKLREVTVGGCNNLVNLFPSNPMPLLQHLEELKVENCGSIKALFNINMDSVGEIGEKGAMSNSLRSIEVKELRNLTEVCCITGQNNDRQLTDGFQAVESIKISNCTRFVDVFTPKPSNMKALMPRMKILIDKCQDQGRNNDFPERICDTEES